jgi:hypothetical protein
VADMFPNTIVRGDDLFPPPVSWVPSNCILEVDDVLLWTWRQKFDLMHIRHGLGIFTPQEWNELYKKCYDNLEAGGWFEKMGMNICCECDDGSIPEDNILFTWRPRFFAAGEKLGKSLNIMKTMRASFEKAGFIDVHDSTP